MEEGMCVLDWPAKSPDMNIIENVWGLLARRVYQGARQFHDLDDLKECIEYEWERLSINEIRDLVLSVPRRIVDVILKRGGSTRY